MLHSRIEVSGDTFARRIYVGDTSRLQVLMNMEEQFARANMENALDQIGALTQAELERLSPIGKGNPGTEHKGGHTPPREPGTLKASWSHDVHHVGSDLVMVVGSDDPVSEFVDKGTGLHATGGTRGLILPSEKKHLAIPASHLAIGGSRGKNKTIKDVRYLKSTRGTRALHLVERAQAAVRPAIGPILRHAAKATKADIKRALKGV